MDLIKHLLIQCNIGYSKTLAHGCLKFFSDIVSIESTVCNPKDTIPGSVEYNNTLYYQIIFHQKFQRASTNTNFTFSCYNASIVTIPEDCAKIGEESQPLQTLRNCVNGWSKGSLPRSSRHNTIKN
jgi:hypothetical protein